MNRSRASEILSPTKRILVVGEMMLDEFIWGKVGRISPEAPVPVVEVVKETFNPGGAANVARNLREFVEHVHLHSLAGTGHDADILRGLLETRGVTLDGANRIANWQDLSGAGHHFDQSTAGFRPVIRPNAHGGRAAVGFDGIDDVLRFSGVKRFPSSGLTIAALSRSPSITGSDDVFLSYAGASTTPEFVRHRAAKPCRVGDPALLTP